MAGLISIIAGRSVAIDTSPFIYYIEENPKYLPIVDEIFNGIEKNLFEASTSVLTLHELLVKPLRDGRADVAESYRSIVSGSDNLRLLDIDVAACERSADLRAKYLWLRTPDALQLAVAIDGGAEAVITNDEKWLKVSEIEVLVLESFLENV